MITLFVFGPFFQLPDPSPFALKTMVQLQMAGLPYRTAKGDLEASPKRKLPYIDDDGLVIGDSTFIRAHLESKYGLDLDKGLDAGQRAQGWAVERMLEDHLYWAGMESRWVQRENFEKGPAHFFDPAPAAIRETLREEVRAKVIQSLYSHGMGRHRPEEITELGRRSLAALSALLGDRSYLAGDEPRASDATAFAMLAMVLTPYFDSALRREAMRLANLPRYVDRMMARYFPDHAWPGIAGDLALAS